VSVKQSYTDRLSRDNEEETDFAVYFSTLSVTPRLKFTASNNCKKANNELERMWMEEFGA
jgi:hypothetical protein